MNLRLVSGLWKMMAEGTHTNGYTFGNEGQYRMTVAVSIEERKRAWGLVYEAYLKQGYASVNTEHLWCGLHDARPDTATFLVSREDRDVATLSVVFDGALGLPADHIYGSELDNLRASGRRPCEIISLASDEREGMGCLDVLKEMFRMAYLTARKLEDCTDIVVTVNPHHKAYYQRRLLFQTIGEERRYEKVSGAPAVLLGLDLCTAESRFEARNGAVGGRLFQHFCLSENENALVGLIRDNRKEELLDSVREWFRTQRPFIWRGVRDLWKGIDKAMEAEESSMDAIGLARAHSYESLPAGGQ